MKKMIEELIGWYGAVAILIAYAAVSFGWLSPHSLVYQILNGTGAFGIVYISLKRKAYQPAALNAVWFVIAGMAIISLLFLTAS